ncbi:hypothetical protein BJV78DRAFT_1255092 [Lactifluus subvellereus]|nr:hypothetical protein BJV78DRAFT_1255092 [Lactifluus subvellereus]
MAFNPPPLLIMKHRGRSVAVSRSDCYLYENVLGVARQTFQSLKDVSPDNELVLLAEIPGYSEAGAVEITKDIWPVVNEIVKSVTVAVESEIQALADRTSLVSPDGKEQQAATKGSPPSRPGASAHGGQTITVTFPGYLRPTPAPVTISDPGLLTKKIVELYETIDAKTGYSSSNSRLTFGGQMMEIGQTLANYNVSSGDAIMVMPVTRPRKPVIYLYPPSSLSHVTVQLSLTPSWCFSAVYPPPQPVIPHDERQSAQSLTWTVAAEPDGTLVDRTTGTEVSYLYWEAIAKSHLVTPDASRASTPVGDAETFDPSRPSVSPGDSILLPISKVPGYLDAALKALTLHTEARTSFITYWLPDLLKHEYVALRFLAQESYEQAAPMRVSPTPDVVTRVFMLFRGVAAADVELWQSASALAPTVAAPDGATSWARVVGVEAERASDRALFRVLEWGGMEVE